MPRISMTLPPITITKKAPPSVPTPVELAPIDIIDPDVTVLGVRYSDNSIKLIKVNVGDYCAVNPYNGDIVFTLVDGAPFFDNISSTNYEEIGDLYEWVEVEVNGYFDWADGVSNAIGFITIGVDDVIFACQYNIFNSALSSARIPCGNFVVRTASLPQFVVLESGANKALGVTKDGITCSLTDIAGAGDPAVEDNAIQYLADNGCDYIDFINAIGSYDNYVKARISSEFYECNINQGVRTAAANNTFFLLGVEYNAAFTVPNEPEFGINISDLTIVEA